MNIRLWHRVYTGCDAKKIWPNWMRIRCRHWQVYLSTNWEIPWRFVIKILIISVFCDIQCDSEMDLNFRNKHGPITDLSRNSFSPSFHRGTGKIWPRQTKRPPYWRSLEVLCPPQNTRGVGTLQPQDDTINLHMRREITWYNVCLYVCVTSKCPPPVMSGPFHLLHSCHHPWF